MSERNLVTVRRIDDCVSHPNADALDLLRIGGWQVVSQKGNFKTGDLCYFFEIDSILPDIEQFKFLIDKQGKQYTNGLGARLRTIKLRGAVSQGLAIPVAEFPELDQLSETLDADLGVYKYEPVEQAGSVAVNAKGEWPQWMPKTDQDRIENVYDQVAALCNRELESGCALKWAREEKLEGSSITIYVKDAEFGVCSRNLDLKMDGSNDDNMFVKTAVDHNFHLICDQPANFVGDWAIRGELVGPGVQGNIYQLTERRIYIYDVWDTAKQKLLTPTERQGFIDYLREIGVTVWEVPSLGLFDVELPSMDEIIGDANGRSVLRDTKREGVVWKASRSVKDRFGRLHVPSFKAISREYLLSEK